MDQNGNLYVADSNNARIRKIDSDGVITTIAGNGSFGVTTEPGLATLVPLVPSHITLGPDEDLYVTTTLGYVQRIFMPESAALSAEERREQGISDGAMITTVAGTGFPGFDGDGGDAKQARFNFPQGLVFGPDSRLYVADTGNHRIRVLTPSTAPLISPGGIVNGASFGGEAAAPGAITSLFGQLLALRSETATETPLPTELADASVGVTDSAGATHAAPLFFVGPAQINFLFPETAALGAAIVRVLRADGESVEASIEVNAVAPGLFFLGSSGVGNIGGLRVAANGDRSAVDIFRFDTTFQEFSAAPIDLGPEGDEIYLSLFGTGIRGVSSVEQLSATVGGIGVPVLGAAAHNIFVGLDQVNIGPLPRSLAGRGAVNIILTVDGVQTNAVSVTVR